MSQTLSSSFARCYGLARVARVWKLSRASVYRSRKETPPDTIARRPGPIGACSDAELADHIRRHLKSYPISATASANAFMSSTGSRPPHLPFNLLVLLGHCNQPSNDEMVVVEIDART